MFCSREKIQRMFLPQDYQEVQAVRPVQPGERRVHTGFDLKIQFEAQVAMDILFSKNDVSIAFVFLASFTSQCFSQIFHQPSEFYKRYGGREVPPLWTCATADDGIS